MTWVERQIVTWYVTNGNPWAGTSQETAARLVRLHDGWLMYAVPVWEGVDEDCGWFWWQADADGGVDTLFDEPMVDEDGRTLVAAVSDVLLHPEELKDD